MSFETVAMISIITEIVVVLAIVLTLFNAFSDGALAKLFTGKGGAAAKSHAAIEQEGTPPARRGREDERSIRHAA